MNGLMSLSEAKFLRTKPACCLLAAMLAWPALPASAPSLLAPASGATPSESGAQADPALPAAPKPELADRKELAEAFTKAAPTSLSDLKAIEQRVESLVARVSPAVVAVEVGNGSGSGVVISEDGLVLSAGHVCGRPNRDVRFTFPNGKTAHGKTLGVSRDSDTGLMRITDPGPWPHAAMGDLQQGQIGDWVLALGHPGGFDLHRSLVVRLGRLIRLAPGVLQTDCTISPGDSGGPLFDMHGRVIGIHSFISSSMTENFHVPVTAYYDTWEQLARAGREAPPRAYAGAAAVDGADGCQLSSVERNGPAFKAGLKAGDLVLRVEGRDIKASASFRRWMAEAEPGETLQLDIKRGGQLLSLNVKVEAPPRSH
jgi:serine protease Do